MRNLNQFYIGGQWQPAQSSDQLTIVNPATEDRLLTLSCAKKPDIDAAVQAARMALPGWSMTPAAERKALMLAAAGEMENRLDDLIDAHTDTMGIPRHQAADYQILAPIEGMRYYAEHCTVTEERRDDGNVQIVREPVGVCALINPWNYPLNQLIGKVAPALATGCTMIAKPAEQTPLPDLIMAEIFHKIGLPAGVFNLIFGRGHEIGPNLCSHPEVDMVSFTGSTRAGVQVAQAAAPTVKRVCQELGGKSAYIITEDADIEAAVTYGVDDVMANSGQTCNALTRMLVPRSKAQQVYQLAVERTHQYQVGNPLDGSSTMGPLVSEQQRQRVVDYIELGVKEGARLLCGGVERPAGLNRGAYVQPTVFGDVKPDMTIACEEIFGPVLVILIYEDLDNAIQMANDSIYGLSSAVYAKDLDSARAIARQLRAGQCYLQGATFTIKAPFGGVKMSGNGREWGEDALAEYLETKALVAP